MKQKRPKKHNRLPRRARPNAHKGMKRLNRPTVLPGDMPQMTEYAFQFLADQMLLSMLKKTGIRDAFLNLLKKQLEKEAAKESAEPKPETPC